MQTTPITYDDLRSSVISVPPLARKADLTLDDAENTKLIKHLEAGGVRSFLYGGNANLYNIAVSEYAVAGVRPLPWPRPASWCPVWARSTAILSTMSTS